MILEDFSQSVTVSGVELRVSDMVIQADEDQPIDRIECRVPVDANPSVDLLNVIQPVAPVVVTQATPNRTMTFRGAVSAIRFRRFGSDDVLELSVEGEAEVLSRIRFTRAFEGMTAGAIVAAAAAEAGLSAAGVQPADIDVGDVIAREDTALDVINACARRTGYRFYVDQGVLYFEPPGSVPAPFAIRRGETLIADSLVTEENASGVRNVVKAVAYEYRKRVFANTVRECVQNVYVEPFPTNFEQTGEARITAPDELSDVSVSVDPQTGRIEFGTPLVLGEPPEDTDEGYQSREFELRVEFSARRPVLLGSRREDSVAIFGERHAQLQPDDGGDDIASVQTKIDSELERKAFPVRRFDCEVTELGLYPGQAVDLEPGGIFPAQTVRVAGIRHTTNGAELEVRARLTSVSYREEDAVPELAARVGNLERDGLHPRSITGSSIQETGEIQAKKGDRTALEIAGEFSVALAGVPKITGAGALAFARPPVETIEAVVPGGGSLSFLRPSAFQVEGRITGGGSLAFVRSPLIQEVTTVTAGGALEFNRSPLVQIPSSITGAGALTAERAPFRGELTSIAGAGALDAQAEALGIIEEPASITGAGSLQVQVAPAEPVEAQRVTEEGRDRVLEDGATARGLEAGTPFQRQASLTGAGALEAQAEALGIVEQPAMVKGAGGFAMLFEQSKPSRITDDGAARVLENGKTLRGLEDD